MDESGKFSRLHGRAFYGDSPKVKLSKAKFEDNSKYAHLIGRAFTCEKLLERHKQDPYESIEVLLGDLQIEFVDCMNQFRKNALYHTGVEKYKVEQLM